MIEMIESMTMRCFYAFSCGYILNFGSVHGPIEEANPGQKSSMSGAMASNEDILHGLLQN